MRFPSSWRGDQPGAAGLSDRVLGHDRLHRVSHDAAAQRAPVLRASRVPAYCTIVAAAMLLAACGKQSDSGFDPTHAPGAGSAMKVGVLTLKPQTINIVDELSGRLSATEVADVRPQVDGIILKRLFVEGSTVKKGQALYQIDPSSYQAAYDTARGTLAKAQATYDAAVKTAQRYEALKRINGVSTQDTENYVAAAAEAKADVITDKASLETARINLQRTTIVAPIAGQIGKSAYTAGALVTAEQTTALSTIQALDTLYLDATRSSIEGLRLREAFASHQREPGNIAVQLTMEDGRPYPQAGRLLFSDVTVDATTGSVTLRSIFPNADHLLLPGMFVRATFSEGSQDDALLVPQNVVTRASNGTSSVMIVDANNKVATRAVTANTAYGNQWIISSGLKAGDRVLTSNLQQVSAGQTITPVEDKAEPATASPSAASDAAASASTATQTTDTPARS
jgi:membrane fusion protein (multidrug efflux system)